MKNPSAPDSSVTRLGLDPVVAISLAGAILFFLIGAASAYFNLEAMRSGNDKIAQSHRAIIALDELLSSMQDAETGQRGFVITNNEKYLEPYHSALIAIPSKLGEVSGLVIDEFNQRKRLTSLRAHIDARLAELKKVIDARRSEGLESAIAVINSDRGKTEMDAVRAQIAGMAEQEARLRAARRTELIDAQNTALASGLASGFLGILLTVAIAFIIRKTTLARRRQEWLQAGELGLASVIMGDQPVGELGNSILDYLAQYLGAAAGAAFVASGESFQRVATYGVPEDANIASQFKRRQGLLGQAAAEGRTVLLDAVPDGYLEFGSALGQDKPKYLLLFPGLNGRAVNSVIELGFLRPVNERVLALVEQASSSIAVAVRSANYRAELQNLLEETQRQSEELQTQSEELRVSNEELEEQSRALKESQSRLEQQQVELEQTNSQLEEQTQQLETQRNDLERVNASVKLKARELEQASRYKSDFLANMSHELRTPLNSSLILAKLLADNKDGNLTEEQVKFAETIQSSGNDLLTLINDILDLSKIEAGHVEIKPESVAIERLAGNLKQVFEPVAKQKELEFVFDVAPECPVSIETDIQRLEQVLKNLLSNAFKFTEAGRVGVAIQLSAQDKIAFKVSDTGIGIAPAQQENIFEAFHQADGTISRKFGGTGLGLSISKQLVRLLGGLIDVESQPGQGSTFTVTVPLTYDPGKVSPREAPSENSIASAAPKINLGKDLPKPSSKVADDRDAPSDNKRVLLVIEDDESFAAILRDLSRESGFRALVAGTAEEALEMAKRYKPNAVVLDVGLSGVSADGTKAA